MEFTGKMTRIDVGDAALAGLTKELDAKMGSNNKPWFKQLASNFGKRSELGQTLALLRGGGAIGGLSLLSNGFGNLAGNLKEYVEWSRAAKRSTAEMGVEFAKQVPLLGGFVSGMETIESMGAGHRITRAAMATDMANRAMAQAEIDAERQANADAAANSFDALTRGSSALLLQGTQDERMRGAVTEADRAELQEQFRIENQITDLFIKKEQMIKKFPLIEEEITAEYERQLGLINAVGDRRKADARDRAEEKRFNDELNEQHKLDVEYAEQEQEARETLAKDLQEQFDAFEEKQADLERAAKEFVGQYGSGSRGTFNPMALQSLQVANNKDSMNLDALRRAVDFIQTRLQNGQAAITWQ